MQTLLGADTEFPYEVEHDGETIAKFQTADMADVFVSAYDPDEEFEDEDEGEGDDY